MLKVAELFEVSIDEFLGLKPEKAKSGPPPKVKVTEKSALPKAKQTVVIDMIEGIDQGLLQAG